MRLFYSLILFTFLLSSQAISVKAVFSADPTSPDCAIVATLRTGSIGEQVKCLQKTIGAKIDGHFGPLTKASVFAWQRAHNLVADGIVGPLTRTVLNRIIVAKGVYLPGCSSNTGYSVTTGKKCDSNLTLLSSGFLASNSNSNLNTGKANPNLKNLDLYVEAVKKGLLKGGLSPDKLPIAEAKIRKQAEEGPDFRQEFYNIQKAIYDKKVSERILKGQILAFFEKMIDETFMPQKAFAVGLSFGGYIIYVNPEICDCPPGIFTQVFVALPCAATGISNMLMDYKNGSQKYSYYNIFEKGIGVLGFYEPGIPSCWMYVGQACSLVKSKGLISPETGSSLTP